MGVHLFWLEKKAGNFERIGEVGEFYLKYWKSQRFLYLLISLYKTLKKLLEMKQMLEKSRKFVSPKKWEPWKNCFGPRKE